jgi:aminoglycoside phosphotransferase (APT) family kinase protein
MATGNTVIGRSDTVLTQSDVVPYLLGKNWIRPSHIVNGGVEVTNASRRNRNYRVMCRKGPRLLLKSATDADKSATITHEAAVYRFLRRIDPGRGFARFLPRYRGFHAAECMLVLDLLDGAESLLDYHARRGRASQTLAATLGRALARLHRSTASSRARVEFQKHCTHRGLDVMNLHCPSLAFYCSYSSGANIELLRIVQASPGFFQGLDDLRQGWREAAVIHGDLRWDNCVIATDPGARSKKRLAIVDWELAMLGDPCWDVACVLCEYLSFWLSSAPITPDSEPEDVDGAARIPLSSLQPAMRRFWLAYRQGCGMGAAALPRIARYAAVRLVQGAIERTHGLAQISAVSLYLLQLAHNILQRPAEAVTALFGLSECECAS